MNIVNTMLWMKRNTYQEYGTENVYETKIDYVFPRKGTWFLAIENTGTLEANVEVKLFVTNG